MPKTDVKAKAKAEVKNQVMEAAIAHIKAEENTLRDLTEQIHEAVVMHRYNLKETLEWCGEAFCKLHEIPWKQKRTFLVRKGRYTSYNSFMTAVRTRAGVVALKPDYDALMRSGRSITDLAADNEANKRTMKRIAKGEESAAHKDVRLKEATKGEKKSSKELAEETGAEYVDTSYHKPEKKKDEPTGKFMLVPNEDTQWKRTSWSIAKDTPKLFMEMIEELGLILRVETIAMIREDLFKQ